MKRFLTSPSGWFALLIVELAVLLVGIRLLSRVFPDLSNRAAWTTVVLAALVLSIVNYVIRRRYLSPP